MKHLGDMINGTFLNDVAALYLRPDEPTYFTPIEVLSASIEAKHTVINPPYNTK